MFKKIVTYVIFTLCVAGRACKFPGPRFPKMLINEVKGEVPVRGKLVECSPYKMCKLEWNEDILRCFPVK